MIIAHSIFPSDIHRDCRIPPISSFVSQLIVVDFSYLALATGEGDVDETAGVDDTLVGTALGLLGLLLLLDLGSGGLDLTGTSEL